MKSITKKSHHSRIVCVTAAYTSHGGHYEAARMYVADLGLRCPLMHESIVSLSVVMLTIRNHTVSVYTVVDRFI